MPSSVGQNFELGLLDSPLLQFWVLILFSSTSFYSSEWKFCWHTIQFTEWGIWFYFLHRYERVCMSFLAHILLLSPLKITILLWSIIYCMGIFAVPIAGPYWELAPECVYISFTWGRGCVGARPWTPPLALSLWKISQCWLWWMIGI